MFTWGLNHRLNTSCADLTCIEDVIIGNQVQGKFPATITDAIAMPEQDVWKYGTNCESRALAHPAGAGPLWRPQRLGALPQRLLDRPHRHPACAHVQNFLPLLPRCCSLHGVLRIRCPRLEGWLPAGFPRLEFDPSCRTNA